jgi:transcriptional regulator with XRE-family HTH domain
MASRKNCDAVTAQRIRAALNNKGWNAQRLSDETGISKSSISQYVNGYSAPSNINAGKIGNALGVSPAWLMGFGDDESKQMDTVIKSIVETKVPTTLFEDKDRQTLYKLVRKMNGESIDNLLKYARYIYDMENNK